MSINMPEVQTFSTITLLARAQALAQAEVDLRVALDRLADRTADLNTALIRAETVEAALAEVTLLLNEWLETPFFETRDEWERWAADFRPRVDGTLQRAMSVAVAHGEEEKP